MARRRGHWHVADTLQELTQGMRRSRREAHTRVATTARQQTRERSVRHVSGARMRTTCAAAAGSLGRLRDRKRQRASSCTGRAPRTASRMDHRRERRAPSAARRASGSKTSRRYTDCTYFSTHDDKHLTRKSVLHMSLHRKRTGGHIVNVYIMTPTHAQHHLLSLLNLIGTCTCTDVHVPVHARTTEAKST